MGDHFGRLRYARKDNIKLELKERDVKVKWIHVTKIRVHFLAFVNILRNF